MRAFVLYAHPCEESYGAALHRTAVDALRVRGAEVDDCDLYAEGFQPVLSPEERRRYHAVGPNLEGVERYVERLRAADALVLVFPVWNFGYPAILKGFFDRVFVPGVSFTLDNGKLAPALANITRLAALPTYGASRLRAFLAGDPPRAVVGRALRACCGARPRYLYRPLYDMNAASEAARTAHLARVAREVERF